MKKQLSQVEKFHEVYSCLKQAQPAPLSEKEIDCRIMLMEEELKEVVEAMRNEPLENVAKELTDLVYVVLGTYVAYGFQDKAEEVFDAVHESNMSKLYVQTR